MKVVVAGHSNRALALIDDSFAHWFMGNLPVFDVLPVSYAGGTLTLSSSIGDIRYILIHVTEPVEKYYHLIIDHPSDISLEEAYKLL